VEDPEEVVRVLVDLRSLAPRKDVLEVEGVPAVSFGEQRRLLQRRCVEMHPGQAVRFELCVAGLSPRVGVPRLRGRPRALDAGKARHRD
jgi:hypothetical protein